ncbi:hypothetical protein IFM89_013690 [Coptis chinensis]|uniref:Protein FAR1-RELATED SEQUENCE n=1 Tax=Coptis chinensis TaxID=261450 RepID=A0A835GZ57_9MAGN|nr:hypothetical protein IFM89_013690 [Coptis chinensis]
MEESHDQESELMGNFSGVADCGTSYVQVEKNTIGSPTKDFDDAIETPYVGMTFKSIEEAKKYYERYGVSKGFSIVTRSSNKSWLHCDMVTNIGFACSHFGSHKKKLNENVERPRLNTSTKRGDCKAYMYVKLRRTTLKWEYIKSKTDGESEHWVVQWNPQTCEGICECNRYEFVGIPCAHILKVLSKLDVYEIPESLINKRWLKGANRFWRGGNEGSLCQEQVDAMNLGYLCQEATKLACIASRTPASYKIFLDGLRELGKQMSEITPDKDVDEEDVPEESEVHVLQGRTLVQFNRL